LSYSELFVESGLSCGIIYVILCLAVLIAYQNVTDTETHDDGIYRVSIASHRVKIPTG